MPCTGLTLTTPSISCLDFLLSWDISGAQPVVTITNNSTVSNAPALKWWFYVVSPSGTPIYGMNLIGLSVLPTPDFNGTAWTTKVINLPASFGVPPCGQIEFSPNSPYNVMVFVQDTVPSVPVLNYYNKSTIIVRPNGNKSTSCGNFGNSAVSVQVDCLNKNINIFDSTNIVYNNIITPTATSQKWTLVYPQDAGGDIPVQTAENTPNVTFKISVNSEGYTVYFQEYATYSYGNGITVTVQYKLFDKSGNNGLTFAINCDTSLCLLQCQLQKLRNLEKSCCGTLEDAATKNKLAQFTAIYVEILGGIFQPVCGGEKVPALIKEALRIADYDGNCDCGCNEQNNFGFSNPIGPTSPGGCCPIQVSIINSATDLPPSACPQSYFPVQVKDPAGASVIGTATDINSLVGILNANGSWQVYGVAFAQGNCKVGWYPATGINAIPNIEVVLSGGTIIPNTTAVSSIFILDTTSPPAGCSGSGPYPLRVYDPTGTTIIGIANSISDVVSLLNNYPAWETYGTASVQDNCHVQWNLANGKTTVPDIQVDTATTSTSCVNGSVIYTVTVNDVCATSSALTPSDFPLNLFIDFGIGGGIISIGNVANMTALISALNATATKPASVTFSTGSVFGQVIATNTNCVAYNGVITLTANLGSMDFLFYGGNHDLMEPTQLGVAAVQAIGLANNSLPGQVKGFVSDDPVWHVIHVDKYMICSLQHLTAGQIKVYDMSVPLFPAFIKAVTLPDTGSGICFSGIPESITVASGGVPITSIYGLYFVTDNPGQMALNAVYVTEPLTGSIWKMDLTPGGAGITGQFAYQKLLGKCPRVILGNKIYYTQDGDLETAASLVSGVTFGDIVILNLSTFNSGGVSTQNVLSNQEQVWAASYDGTSIINFVGNLGTLATYTVSTSTVANRYLNAFSACLYRLNIKSYLNVIFASSFDFVGKTTGTQRLTITSLPTITRTDFQSFKKPGSSVFNTTHYNALPLGNCLVAVTTDNWQDPASKTGMLVIYAVDGTFITQIGYDAGDIYNVISFPGIGNYTPNGLT